MIAIGRIICYKRLGKTKAGACAHTALVRLYHDKLAQLTFLKMKETRTLGSWSMVIIIYLHSWTLDTISFGNMYGIFKSSHLLENVTTKIAINLLY
jgi:hypothetical protein